MTLTARGRLLVLLVLWFSAFDALSLAQGGWRSSDSLPHAFERAGELGLVNMAATCRLQQDEDDFPSLWVLEFRPGRNAPDDYVNETRFWLTYLYPYQMMPFEDWDDDERGIAGTEQLMDGELLPRASGVRVTYLLNAELVRRITWGRGYLVIRFPRGHGAAGGHSLVDIIDLHGLRQAIEALPAPPRLSPEENCIPGR